MADVETRVDKLETKVTTLEQQVSNVATKLDMFIAESREARKKFDEDMREMRQKHDDDMRGLRADIGNLGNSFRTMNVTVIVGIAAMIIAILLK